MKDSIITILRIISRLLPHAAAAALLLFAAQVWYEFSPPIFRTADIVNAQLIRATTLGDSDLVIIGDSSCLMGVDAEQLSRQTHLDVESLCTYATLGPEGWGIILDRYLSRGRKTKAVLLMMHPQPFDRPEVWRKESEAIYNWKDTRFTPPPPTASFPLGAKYKFIREVQKLIASNVLSGRWGNFYGTYANLEKWTLEHKGSALDPTPIIEKERGYGLAPQEIKISDEMVYSLRKLRPVLEKFDGPKYIIISPVPGYFESADTIATLVKVRSVVLHELGLTEDNLLPLPTSLSEKYFASYFDDHGNRGVHMHHLNKTGVIYFSTMLSDILNKKNIASLPSRSFTRAATPPVAEQEDHASLKIGQ